MRHLLKRGADPRVHPFTRYGNAGYTVGYLYIGGYHPPDMTPQDFQTYRAELIRLLVPLEPASGFTSYESRLADAAREKNWAEVEAYVASGVAPDEAIKAVHATLALTSEERAHALKLLNATK